MNIIKFARSIIGNAHGGGSLQTFSSSGFYRQGESKSVCGFAQDVIVHQ
jgi:hypothetical protein